MITDKIIQQILKDQHGVCCNCGRDLYQGYHVHHCCYTRDVRFSKWLDQIQNLVALCPRCHSQHGKLSNIEGRKRFYKYKLELGYEMHKWADSIPMLVRDRFEE